MTKRKLTRKEIQEARDEARKRVSRMCWAEREELNRKARENH